MADIPPPSSPKWKTPNEVMRLHLLKKKRALAARMNSSDSPRSVFAGSPTPDSSKISETSSSSSKNRFRRVTNGVKRAANGEPVESGLNVSDENTIFHLLSEPSSPRIGIACPTSFSSILGSPATQSEKRETKKNKGENFIPIDWTLRTKVRFMSPKPFAFNPTLRTCEEASGITGFVRCLDTSEQNSTLDTSPSARLHQCSLIWQHPSLPWLELYPRRKARASSSEASTANILPAVRDSLQQDWTKSFQSLFQLLRARQCPYFYLCANNFTCLFRAAGICGISEIHALMTPTTRGFRQLLKDADVEFTMPLKKSGGKRRSDGISRESGYETNDSDLLESSSQPKDEDQDGEEDESDDRWLEKMGIEAAEIRRLNIVQVQQTIDKECDIDKTPESLIMVEGVETQALCDFLLNAKTCTPSTGPLAGVPPTLLAPVAFSGATLRSLKVRVNKVQVDDASYHSVELQGPILPHIVLNLCHLMLPSSNEFSLAFANLESTKAFSLVGRVSVSSESEEESLKKNESNIAQANPSVFGQENLSDCGFSRRILESFCSPEAKYVQVMESLKYSDGLFTWL